MIIKFDRYLPLAKEERTIHMYLPDDYDFSDERYPVMYMLDGQNLFIDEDATYGFSWGIADFLDHWDKKMIVVGIQCADTGKQRAIEYLPFHCKAYMAGEIDGRCEETMQYIIQDLKPYIDSNFRTWSHREATGIAGSSYGGAAAAYGIFYHNDVFSKAALVSPSFGVMKYELDRKLDKNDLHEDTRIFFSFGSEEGGPAYENMVAHFESRANQNGSMTYYYKQMGGNHSEFSWRQQLDLWFDFLWK